MATWHIDVHLDLRSGSSNSFQPRWYNSQTIYPAQQTYGNVVQAFLANCHDYCTRIEWGAVEIEATDNQASYNPTYQARSGSTVIQTYNFGSQRSYIRLWSGGSTTNATYCKNCHNFNFYRSGGSIPGFRYLNGGYYVYYFFELPYPEGQIISRNPNTNSTGKFLSSFTLNSASDPISRNFAIVVNTYYSSHRQIGGSAGSIIYGGQLRGGFGSLIEEYCR